MKIGNRRATKLIRCHQRLGYGKNVLLLALRNWERPFGLVETLVLGKGKKVGVGAEDTFYYIYLKKKNKQAKNKTNKLKKLVCSLIFFVCIFFVWGNYHWLFVFFYMFWFAIYVGFVILMIITIFFYIISFINFLTLRPRKTYIYVFRALFGFSNF